MGGRQHHTLKRRYRTRDPLPRNRSAVSGSLAIASPFPGTVLGYQLHSDPLELCFDALAGGAIVYVVAEIWAAARRTGHRLLGPSMLSVGFLVGIATDLVVTCGGA